MGDTADPLPRSGQAPARDPRRPVRLPRIRRIERELPAEYERAVDELLADLKPANLDEAASIAALPSDIRGYEDLKLARVAEFRQRLAERLDAFRRTVA